MSLPIPSPQEARRACEESKPFAKLAEKRLPFAEVKRELRGAVITEHADGKGMDIHDPTPDKRHIKRLYEMQAERRALEYEIGQNSVLSTFPESERERVRQSDGAVVALPPEQAAAAGQKGAHAVIHWGRPKHRTVVQADGLHLVYHAEPGAPLMLTRAYRLVDNGDRTTHEVEVPIG